MSSDYQSSHSYLLGTGQVKQAASKRKAAVFMLVAAAACVAVFGIYSSSERPEITVLAQDWNTDLYGNINLTAPLQVSVDAVLLRNGWASAEGVRTSSDDNKRNNLIGNLAGKSATSVPEYQKLDDTDLASIGVFGLVLREIKRETVQSLKTKNWDSWRNSAILAVNQANGPSIPEIQQYDQPTLARALINARRAYVTVGTISNFTLNSTAAKKNRTTIVVATTTVDNTGNTVAGVVLNFTSPLSNQTSSIFSIDSATLEWDSSVKIIGALSTVAEASTAVRNGSASVARQGAYLNATETSPSFKSVSTTVPAGRKVRVSAVVTQDTIVSPYQAVATNKAGNNVTISGTYNGLRVSNWTLITETLY